MRVWLPTVRGRWARLPAASSGPGRRGRHRHPRAGAGGPSTSSSCSCPTPAWWRCSSTRRPGRRCRRGGRAGRPRAHVRRPPRRPGDGGPPGGGHQPGGPAERDGEPRGGRLRIGVGGGRRPRRPDAAGIPGRAAAAGLAGRSLVAGSRTSAGGGGGRVWADDVALDGPGRRLHRPRARTPGTPLPRPGAPPAGRPGPHRRRPPDRADPPRPGRTARSPASHRSTAATRWPKDRPAPHGTRPEIANRAGWRTRNVGVVGAGDPGGGHASSG